MLSIPKQSSDITTEWLAQALALGGVWNKPKVVDISVEGIGSQMGFTAINYRCNLTLEDASTASVIVKGPNSNPKVLRFVDKLGFYKKECIFYQQFATTITLKTPKLYYSQLNDRKNFVLILEDLQYLDTADQVVGANRSQIKSAVQGLASMHGTYWQKTNRIARVGLSGDRKKELLIAQIIYPGTLLRVLDSVGVQISDEKLNFMKELGYRITTFSDELLNAPQTLVHGDYRLDNMFFSRDGDNEVNVIDWQTATSGLGLRDLAYFMCTSVTPEMRKATEQEILQEYYEIVCSTEHVENYSMEDCWLHYRLGIIFSLIVCVTAMGGLLIKGSRTDELALKVVERLMSAMDDHHVYELLPSRPPTFSFSNLIATAVRLVSWTKIKRKQ